MPSVDREVVYREAVEPGGNDQLQAEDARRAFHAFDPKSSLARPNCDSPAQGSATNPFKLQTAQKKAPAAHSARDPSMSLVMKF